MTDIIEILNGAKEIRRIDSELGHIPHNSDNDSVIRNLIEHRRAIESSLGRDVSLEDVVRIVSMFANTLHLPENLDSLRGTLLQSALIERSHFRMIAGFDIADIISPDELNKYIVSDGQGNQEYVNITHANWGNFINALMHKKGKLPVFQQIKVPYEKSAARFDHRFKPIIADNTKLVQSIDTVIITYMGLESRQLTPGPLDHPDSAALSAYFRLLRQLPSTFSLDQVLAYRNYLVKKVQSSQESLEKERSLYDSKDQAILELQLRKDDPLNYESINRSLKRIIDFMHGTYILTRDSFPHVTDTGRNNFHVLKKALDRVPETFTLDQLMILRRVFIKNFNPQIEIPFDESEFYVKGKGIQLSLDIKGGK